MSLQVRVSRYRPNHTWRVEAFGGDQYLSSLLLRDAHCITKGIEGWAVGELAPPEPPEGLPWQPLRFLSCDQAGFEPAGPFAWLWFLPAGACLCVPKRNA